MSQSGECQIGHEAEPEAAPTCTVRWGHCAEESPRYFGKPSATPHVCEGVPRHRAKIHKCANCKCVGAPVKPVAFTRAGRELLGFVVGQRVRSMLQPPAVTRVTSEPEK
jgi:hypothetical protein